MSMMIGDVEFQTKILSLMLYNEGFLHDYSEYISADIFSRVEHKILCTNILEYYEHYHTNPEQDVLLIQLRHSGAITERYPESEWVKFIDTVKSMGKTGMDFVYDNFTTWVNKRTIQEACLSATKHLHDTDDVEAATTILYEALSKHNPMSKRLKPVEFFEDIYSFLTEEDIRSVVPSGIPELDAAMGGGPARGELTTVLAPPGVGKTTTLINFGSHAVKSGGIVYHFHAEQTSSVIRSRYIACMQGINIRDIRGNPMELAYKLQQLGDSSGGDLIIQNCAGSSIKNIRAFLYKYGKPDVVIIDYADKLTSQRKYVERRHEIANIYDDMIKTAQEFDCHVITASQGNRESLGKSTINMRHLAESFEKGAIVDNLIALCQTDEEKLMDECRLLMLKTRNEAGDKEISCNIDRNKMRITSKRDFNFKVNSVLGKS